jgi:16S rRNA C967 or C1407 C5-methylase (RsmB/RsmF family)
MEQAPRLLQKFSQKLFPNPSEQAQFVEALIQPRLFHPCILWLGQRPESSPFGVELPLDWQPSFVDRLALDAKPGRHPLHNQGAFYCLDFSSVFAASVLLQIERPVATVLDMCAAPGGKSIFAWKALQPQSLVSNEVIGKRLGALTSNLKRCQVQPCFATTLDSSVLAAEIPQSADLVIVDAPCTGQSLLAKGEKNPGCFHPVNINKNANRQKRILANSAQIVAPQGFLAYMTCAYSPEENEQVTEWLLQKFPQFQPVEVPYLAAYQSHLTALPCYRMFPHTGLGAGAFTVLLQNTALSERDDSSQLGTSLQVDRMAAQQKLTKLLEHPKVITIRDLYSGIA